MMSIVNADADADCGMEEIPDMCSGSELQHRDVLCRDWLNLDQHHDADDEYDDKENFNNALQLFGTCKGISKGIRKKKQFLPFWREIN